MCGILAVIGGYRYKEIPDALIERGPDDYGIYQDELVQLIQTRLEITPCEIHLPYQLNNLVLLFNGEIYNWKELSEELNAENEYEVILKAFKRYGADFREQLDGQFTILIYDKDAGMIYIYQDDFKIHALYKTKYNDSFIYASNLRSFPEVKFDAIQTKGYGNISTATVL